MNSKYLKLLKQWVSFGILTLLFAMCPLGLIAAEGVTNEPAANPASATAANSPHTWLTFGLDRVEWLQVSVMGNPLWQYLAALLYVVLAFYTSKLLDYLIRGQLRKLTSKTKTQADDVILELVRGPVKIVVFVVLLHF